MPGSGLLSAAMGERRGTSRSGGVNTGRARARSTGRAVSRAAGVVVLAAVLAASGACSSGGDAQPPAFPTTSTSASSSPTPKTARAQVEQVVRDYYAAMDLAIRTGETESISSLSTADCPCRTFVKSVETLFSTARTRGASVRLESVEIEEVRGGYADVDVVVNTAAYESIHADGTVRKYPRGRDTAIVGLLRANGGWRVATITFLDREESG